MDYWLLGGIAVWRLTKMLHNERGPMDIFARLRANLAKGQRHMGGLYDMFSCFYCLSIWVAMIPSFFIATSPLNFVFAVLALSGTASLVYELLVKLK